MKQVYKNKQINLRLTEMEFLDLKEKSQHYPNLSSFILDACTNFDDALGIKRLNVIRQWSADYKKYEADFNKLGSNINQLAHYVNKLNITGVNSYEILPEVNRQLHTLIDLLTEMNSSNLNFKKNANDFFKRKHR